MPPVYRIFRGMTLSVGANLHLGTIPVVQAFIRDRGGHCATTTRARLLVISPNEIANPSAKTRTFLRGTRRYSAAKVVTEDWLTDSDAAQRPLPLRGYDVSALVTAAIGVGGGDGGDIREVVFEVFISLILDILCLVPLLVVLITPWKLQRLWIELKHAHSATDRWRVSTQTALDGFFDVLSIVPLVIAIVLAPHLIRALMDSLLRHRNGHQVRGRLPQWNYDVLLLNHREIIISHVKLAMDAAIAILLTVVLMLTYYRSFEGRAMWTLTVLQEPTHPHRRYHSLRDMLFKGPFIVVVGDAWIFLGAMFTTLSMMYIKPLWRAIMHTNSPLSRREAVVHVNTCAICDFGCPSFALILLLTSHWLPSIFVALISFPLAHGYYAVFVSTLLAPWRVKAIFKDFCSFDDQAWLCVFHMQCRGV